MRLSTRLSVAFVAVALAAVALLAALTLVAARSEISGLVDTQRAQTTREVSDALAAAYGAAGSWEQADLQSAFALARSAGATLVVRDAGGTLVAGPGSGRTGPGGRGLGPGRPATGPSMSARVVSDGTRVGTATLRFATGGLPAPERQVRDALVRRVLVAGGLAILLALLVAAFVSRRITRPLERLRGVVARMERGDRHARSGMSGARDEVGELARAFDRMGDALEREDTLRRSLTADVAHELRTPLTVLQGHCEAFLDGVEEPTPERLASLHDEVLRLGRLVEDVESLAAAEAAGLGLRRSPVDLAAVAAEAAELLRPRFESAEIELHCDLHPAIVDGDGDRLAQVVTNLLTNALKFTPGGGHVTLGVGADDGRALLRVADDGPGIPADELAQVFTRFWRGRGAAGTSGSGVGLAVVDELVRAHGGSVAVSSPPGGGTVFTAGLPLTGP